MAESKELFPKACKSESKWGLSPSDFQGDFKLGFSAHVTHVAHTAAPCGESNDTIDFSEEFEESRVVPGRRDLWWEDMKHKPPPSHGDVMKALEQVHTECADKMFSTWQTLQAEKDPEAHSVRPVVAKIPKGVGEYTIIAKLIKKHYDSGKGKIRQLVSDFTIDVVADLVMEYFGEPFIVMVATPWEAQNAQKKLSDMLHMKMCLYEIDWSPALELKRHKEGKTPNNYGNSSIQITRNLHILSKGKHFREVSGVFVCDVANDPLKTNIQLKAPLYKLFSREATKQSGLRRGMIKSDQLDCSLSHAKAVKIGILNDIRFTIAVFPKHPTEKDIAYYMFMRPEFKRIIVWGSTNFVREYNNFDPEAATTWRPNGFDGWDGRIMSADGRGHIITGDFRDVDTLLFINSTSVRTAAQVTRHFSHTDDSGEIPHMHSIGREYSKGKTNGFHHLHCICECDKCIESVRSDIQTLHDGVNVWGWEIAKKIHVVPAFGMKEEKTTGLVEPVHGVTLEKIITVKRRIYHSLMPLKNLEEFPAPHDPKIKYGSKDFIMRFGEEIPAKLYLFERSMLCRMGIRNRDHYAEWQKQNKDFPKNPEKRYKRIIKGPFSWNDYLGIDKPIELDVNLLNLPDVQHRVATEFKKFFDKGEWLSKPVKPAECLTVYTELRKIDKLLPADPAKCEWTWEQVFALVPTTGKPRL